VGAAEQVLNSRARKPPQIQNGKLPGNFPGCIPMKTAKNPGVICKVLLQGCFEHKKGVDIVSFCGPELYLAGKMKRGRGSQLKISSEMKQSGQLFYKYPAK
jgi:hypothetical protein